MIWHRHLNAGLIAACAAALLTGCGGDIPTAASSSSGTSVTLPPSTSSAPPSPTTPAGPSTNSRGNIAAALGEQHGFGGTTLANAAVTFALDSIAPVQCTNIDGLKPVNGVFVAAHFRVGTGTPAAFNEVGMSEPLNPLSFSYIGSDNITVSSIATPETYECLPENQYLPGQMGPGQQYAGDIVFDLPAAHGALVLELPGLSNASGWEWDF